MSMRGMLIGGLALMSAAAVATAIWPAVGTAVSAVLAALVALALLTPTVLAVRWVRAELAWRRELHVMPAATASTEGSAPVAPTLAELRESA